jgi:TonB-dependent receptor
VKNLKNNNTIQRTTISMAIAIALTSSLAIAEDNNKKHTEHNGDMEVIIVKGIAGSLAESARQKRFDSRIIDSIVAEDIGKLPDNNIAEALQRITGVSISTEFGVGQSITIRGISENRVELNGRSTAGSGRGGISLDAFPSSFLKAVEVVKSPTPEMIEGALGGTVNMKTVRPLELEESLVSMSLDAEYSDKTEHTAPIFTGAAGTNWDLGESGSFGLSAMLSYQDRELKKEDFQTLQELRDFDLDGDGINDVGNTPNGKFIINTQNTIEQKTEIRERTAYGLSLQWAPESSDGNIYLDINGTSLEGGEEAYEPLDVGGTPVATTDTYQDSNGVIHNYRLEGVILLPKTKSDFSETDSYSNALGGAWNFTDQLSVSGEIALSNSKTTRSDSDFYLRPVNKTQWELDGGYTNAAVHSTNATIVSNGDKIPGITYDDGQVLLDPENLSLRTLKNDYDNQENEELAIRFDIEYGDFGVDFISSIKAGVRSTDRDYNFTRSDYEAKDIYKKATNADGNYAIWIDDERLDGLIKTISYDNAFAQTGISSRNDLLTYKVFDGNALKDVDATFLKVQELLEGTNLARTGSLADNREVDENEFRKINEKTHALYTQFHLDFDDVSAIVGARYVETELASSIIEDGALKTGYNDYSDLLPSLNVTWNLNDDSIVRFAAAKVMRRADFSELSPAYSIDSSLVTGNQGAIDLEPYRVTQYDLSAEHYFGKGGLVSAAIFYKDVESFTVTDSSCIADEGTIGSQKVEEWTSVCQLNAVGQDNPNIVKANADDYATSDEGRDYVQGLSDAGLTGIRVDTNVNGGSGSIKGLELAYQQQFSFLPGALSGLGINTNYTYADSEQPNGNQLQNISKNTINAQVYWEYEGFQIRVAYNWRDRYLDNVDEKRVRPIGALGYGVDDNSDTTSPTYDPTAGNSYREARGQVDFSTSWDITPDFTVVANATNLTGEPIVYTSELGSIWQYQESDARYSIGVRAKF